MSFWTDKKVIVTGGAGFLGSFVVGKLRARGATEIIVPQIEDYNFVELDDIKRFFSDISLTRNDPNRSAILLHLAAKVGGIGANRANPASFFYDNLLMGVQLLHESYKAAVKKFVAIGTVCSYPKHTPVPFK